MARPKKITSAKGVKKGTKRGPYKKNKPTAKWSGKIETPTFTATYTEPEPEQKHFQVLEYDKEIHVSPKETINEIDFLAIFCDNFNSFDEGTRQRLAGFIKSKYYNYF